MDQVKQFCDRAVWLYKGEIRQDGKVDDVLKEYLRVCGWLVWTYLKSYIIIENY